MTEKWNVSIIYPTSPSGEEFYENCISITEWAIGPTSEWFANAGKCEARDTDIDDNMTSPSLDLSGALNANLSFDYETEGLDFGEYFRVYVNSSSSSWKKVLDITGTTGPTSTIIVLEDYITLDSKVHVRGDCKNSNSGEACIWDNINVTKFM